MSKRNGSQTQEEAAFQLTNARPSPNSVSVAFKSLSPDPLSLVLLSNYPVHTFSYLPSDRDFDQSLLCLFVLGFALILVFAFTLSFALDFSLYTLALTLVVVLFFFLRLLV